MARSNSNYGDSASQTEVQCRFCPRLAGKIDCAVELIDRIALWRWDWFCRWFRRPTRLPIRAIHCRHNPIIGCNDQLWAIAAGPAGDTSGKYYLPDLLAGISIDCTDVKPAFGRNWLGHQLIDLDRI